MIAAISYARDAKLFGKFGPHGLDPAFPPFDYDLLRLASCLRRTEPRGLEARVGSISAEIRHDELEVLRKRSDVLVPLDRCSIHVVVAQNQGRPFADCRHPDLEVCHAAKGHSDELSLDRLQRESAELPAIRLAEDHLVLVRVLDLHCVFRA